MNFQTSKKKTGICFLYSNHISGILHAWYDLTRQQLAIIGFCEFCSIPSQEKQKKPLLDNKLSTSWPLLSPHLWQSPLRFLQIGVSKAWFEGLGKKKGWASEGHNLATISSHHPCWVNDVWKKHIKLKLFYQIDGMKNMNSWRWTRVEVKPNESLEHRQEPPALKYALPSSLPMAWYLCRKKFQYLSMEAKECATIKAGWKGNCRSPV